MTVSDVPLADATPIGRSGGSNARMSTRARVRIAATLRGRNILTLLVRMAPNVAGDARRWWLVASRPASLRAWRRAQTPDVARVPDGNAWVRRAWVADNWTTGVAAVGLSVALYLAAGGVRWLAGHPARRWVALLMAAGIGVWVWST